MLEYNVLVLIFCFINSAYFNDAVNYFYFVQNCPMTEDDWRRRSAIFGLCAEEMPYHCSLTGNGSLAETCIARRVVESQGV